MRHNVANVTAAHLHSAPAGVNGPIAIPIMPITMEATGTLPITAEQVALLETGGMYANVHSMANMNGEIRGQVLKPGEALWVAKLDGAQEVPPVTTTATGTGSVIVNAARDGIRYHLNSMLTPTMAHIHKAPGGVSGPVEIPIDPLGMAMTGVRTVTAAQLADLARGLWYFNIHTAANTSGEIRGQIIRPGETLYTAVMSGANEVPPVTTTGTGGVGFILNLTKTSLRYEGSVMGFTPTVAHIHAGAAGVAGPIVYPLMLMGTTLSGDVAVTSADVAMLDAAGYYANVHSAANANGEIRGQIQKR
jgi:hypothetical protein